MSLDLFFFFNKNIGHHCTNIEICGLPTVLSNEYISFPSLSKGALWNYSGLKKGSGN